ncbi:flagellar basal body P-ring formation chaperone FlgA [Chthonobacter rhizosphaerae]|uniref:flagellar basal body P-ring formation chaperone FlgA n=1 Tax=Chthonobacter rhizosphaerae TaxID=2735553 RepID=UPI0015EFCE51|nr:flagellar basal body P-ring formation chaperone FlgA [Chthonobacter rhizosphaerae]
MSPSLSTAVRGGVALLWLSGASPAAADPLMLPVPRMVIYPGEIITGDMLDDGLFPPSAVTEEPLVRSPDEVIGRAAKRTLLPDRPIPIRATAAAAVISRGTIVSVVLEDGALVISAKAQSLDNGGVGDLVRVRNVDSGLVVQGTVGSDGTVRVGIN